jgi:hypothetical protein
MVMALATILPQTGSLLHGRRTSLAQGVFMPFLAVCVSIVCGP